MTNTMTYKGYAARIDYDVDPEQRGQAANG